MIGALLTYWRVDALTALLLALLMVSYVMLPGGKERKQWAAFSLAVALLVLCFISPLHLLSAQYLFSVHMVVHVLLLLIVGPLLVLSLPPDLQVGRIGQAISKRPWLCWFAGVGSMWVWHIPAVFNTAMHQTGMLHTLLHLLENGSLIISGMLFSWPILVRNNHSSLHPLMGVLYLFSACLCCSLLGLLITFAPAATYLHYLSHTDAIGLNETIRLRWGISQQTDQQAAGLIMWVPCCFVYLSGCMYLLAAWFGEKEPAEIIALPEKFTA